jgi:hypothetical protein
MKNNCCQLLFKIVFILLLPLISSCGPKINSFAVSPLTMTTLDTLRVNWDVRGTPTLLIHFDNLAEGNIPQDSDSTIGMLELDLVAKSGDKEQFRRTYIEIVPALIKNTIVFTTEIKGDSLVAAGIKNPLRWAENFKILTVSSNVSRPITIRHSGHSASLNTLGAISEAFKNTTLQGEWQFTSPLTKEEKNSQRSNTEELSIIANCKYERSK